MGMVVTPLVKAAGVTVDGGRLSEGLRRKLPPHPGVPNAKYNHCRYALV